jgi:hypothetical protein
MSNAFSRTIRFAALTLLLSVAGAATAATVGYGPGGLPDLSAYPVGQARFDTMSAALGTPVSLSTNGSNAVTDALWWLPAQGYAAPAATSTAEAATRAASTGFFSRLRNQAVGTVAGMVPGVGGVVAGQAATAVAASVPVDQGNGTAVPGWWCRGTFTGSTAILSSLSCAPHAYTPVH